ncbi:MAG TPA: nitrile hydratase subunit alpha [Nitrospinae bacterium]|nr:nitrile hydratase subunit alpha [Nitrospinota bacterium]
MVTTNDPNKYQSHKSRSHGNGGGHDHDHADAPVERIEHDLDYFQVRVLALAEILKEKGILTTDEMRRAVEDIYSKTPAIGSRVVARSWADPAFKERLLENAAAACDEMEINTSGINHLVALENTEEVHYMVVCTLCSCYPRPLLGQPPTWYKSFPYRSKAVADPRGALKDLGYEVPEDIELRVVDSTADCRYLILPRRPAGTEGWSEEKLTALVTRDSMIGVGNALTPAEFEAGSGALLG